MYQPYKESSTNLIYDMLFCDSLQAFKPREDAALAYPWNVVFAEKISEPDLTGIIHDPAMESRVKLLACLALRQNDIKVGEKALLGVVIELGLEDGLDVLASYRDGTARYINYTGRMIIWESPNEESDHQTDALFSESEKILSQIGPWHKPRRPFPAKDALRISFLASDGLYFGEGPINTMFGDPFAAPALQAATALMQFLTSK